MIFLKAGGALTKASQIVKATQAMSSTGGFLQERCFIRPFIVTEIVLFVKL